MKHWKVSKIYVCSITGENCGDIVCDYHHHGAPDCAAV